MILCIDAGNTRVKWGWRSAGRWVDTGGMASGKADGLAAVRAAGTPAWIGISCVAGQAVREGIERALGAEADRACWLSPAAEAHGIVNRYERPESLGADRYAALIAARRLEPGPCVVASVGTALCIDALTGRGEFLGGMILPGAGLMRQALSSGTAGVAAVAGDWVDFPRCTGDAVETGVWSAMAGALMALRARLAEREGVEVAEVALMLGGGDAARLAGHLPGQSRVVEGLVLEGLLWVARDLGVPGV